MLDPDFGGQLHDAWSGKPIWITMSPTNTAVVHALWVNAPSPSHLITGFRYDERATAEDRLLAMLDAIDLHHGPFSTASPYTTLRVIGAQLADPVQDALTQLGFSVFQPSIDGFVATRSVDEAKRLRD